MTLESLIERIDQERLPVPSDAPPLDVPTLADDAPGAPVWQAFIDDPRGWHFLSFVAAHSSYLTNLIRRDTEFFAQLLSQGTYEAVSECLDALPELDDPGITLPTLMQGLRKAKRRVALGVAVADLLGLWRLDQLTGALSRLAEETLERAVRHALREWRGAEGTDGFVVLGLGKLGSRELNYSSDIDLMVLYDSEVIVTDRPDRLRQDMVRVTRQIMRIMDERTADGFVFRTDLRLRPDPGATPLALEMQAAETYYGSVGQNWERAAMIKARAVSGDRAMGKSFLRRIRPFVWRKYLDFAAIQDIHSIKRQINAHRGGTQIAVDGHNIKLGRGGIREIEFFAQTQQLIWGGRQPDLRIKETCPALEQLASNGHVAWETVDDLKEAYIFLRTLEHRLQMVADQQTQTIPEAENDLAALARFMGFTDPATFRVQVREVLKTVAGHYGRLFEEADDLGAGGSLVFTGTEDDPDTLETLARMGFDATSHVAERVRIWHHGRYRATRSERSRQILTELMPCLLQAFAETANPDDAFKRFDNFLSGLPSGVQLFSLFQAYPVLLDLVSEILGGAPRLADWMSRKPILLDSVLSADFFDPIDPAAWADGQDDDLAQALEQAQDYQDVLDTVRRWSNDRSFRIGVHLLRGIADGNGVGPALTGVAEVGLNAVLPATEEAFAETHGRFAGPGMAVVAFGKLGGMELLPMSDLDLIFVYETKTGAESSDGPKLIGPQVYYLRLCQRLVTAITTETGEGRLYDVDTRLRPAGNAGALATQFDGFQAYYRVPEGDAWTWEHMALTRARPVFGDPAFRDRIADTIRKALIQPRDLTKVVVDVDDMRQRVVREFPGTSDWDVKYRRGGLLDVEFITQFLQLMHAHQHPDVLATNTSEALDRLASAGVLDVKVAQSLRDVLGLWRRLQAVIRLTAPGGGFDADAAPDGQKRVLARAAGVDRFEDLSECMRAAAETASRSYELLIAEPAAECRDAGLG